MYIFEAQVCLARLTNYRLSIYGQKTCSLTRIMSIRIANVYSLRNYRDSRRVRLKLANEPKNWEETLAQLLDNPKPLLFGRLGGVEAMALGIYLDELAGLRDPIILLAAKILRGKRRAQLCNNAGVYPITREIVSIFCEQHLKALEMVDVLSV